MTTAVSGAYAFEDIPTVNGLGLLINGGGTGTILTGVAAARPVSATAGNIFIDTTNSYIWRDTGAGWVQLSTGTLLQTVSGQIVRTTGTTIITTANTATPNNTDGFQIWSQVFTPKSASSKIIISSNLMLSSNTATKIAVASVFAGSTNVGVASTSLAVVNTPYMLTYSTVYSPGAVTPITFTCRVGPTTAATLSVQQYNGTTNTFGNSAQTNYIIQEVL